MIFFQAVLAICLAQKHGGLSPPTKHHPLILQSCAETSGTLGTRFAKGHLNNILRITLCERKNFSSVYCLKIQLYDGGNQSWNKACSHRHFYIPLFFGAFCEMFDFTIILLQHIIQGSVHGYFFYPGANCFLKEEVFRKQIKLSTRFIF